MAETFRDAELSGWTARAESYDKLFTPISNQAIPQVLAALGDVHAKRVLDVCCGLGHLTAALAASGADAEGLDFASTMVKRASANHRPLSFHHGDAESLPFPDEAFDHVVCCYGVMHLARPDQAIAEAHRVLKPGGKYVFTQWARDDELLAIVASAVGAHGSPTLALPPAPPPMRFSDPDECRRVLKSTGFDKVEVERLDITWTSPRAEALLELITGGAVRAAMMIDAQPPPQRTRVQEAITEAARARTSGDTVMIRRPTVMASGQKRSPPKR
jgi:SAM-dependent methyltransferase